MSLFSNISRFRTPGTGPGGTYIVTRTAPGDYVATGEYAPGSTSTVNIVACIQPYDAGRHTVTLPEGVRTEDVRELWTTTELHVDDVNDTADVIEIPGGLSAPAEPYYVFKVLGPWTMSGRTHFVAFAARRKKP